jgi:hypothetical protein
MRAGESFKFSGQDVRDHGIRNHDKRDHNVRNDFQNQPHNHAKSNEVPLNWKARIPAGIAPTGRLSRSRHGIGMCGMSRAWCDF